MPNRHSGVVLQGRQSIPSSLYTVSIHFFDAPLQEYKTGEDRQAVNNSV